MNLVMPLATPAGLPSPVSDAMRRVAAAEHELNRVYPLFATKLDVHPSSANAEAELRAFAAEVRAAHHTALNALRSWSLRSGSLEDAAASYESLADIIEGFTRRAGLEASELD